MTRKFQVGEYVNVTPKQDDVFSEEFAGIITSLRGDNYVVTDQEDETFEVEEDQLESLE